MSYYRLVMRSGPSVGKYFPVEKTELFIGRDLNNDIVINDPEVSRRHSRVFLQGTTYVIEDLGSTNGTSVNGQRLMGPHALRPGELVTLGEQVSLLFEMEQVDPDATVVGAPPARPQAAPVEQPLYTPPPQAPQQPQQPPVYIPPQQAYAQQQPPAYTPAPPPPPQQPQQQFYGQPPAPAKKKSNKKTLIIILVLIVLFLIVCCGIALFTIDAMNLWCTLFPFLFQGACP